MTATDTKGLSEKEKHLQMTVNKALKQLLWQTAEIDLECCTDCCCDVEQQDLCSVYTTFNTENTTRFVFCAERSLMKRITEIMLEEPVTDLEEIAEYMEEFLNVLCGHIAASLFRVTKSAVRFHPPCFMEGDYMAEEKNTENMIVSYFTNEDSESAIISHDHFLSKL